MEWRDCKEDMERFNRMTLEEVGILVKGGEQTEFWKFLRSRMAQTLMSLETNLIRTRVNSLDDAMKLARFAEAYKSVEEVFNTPNIVAGSTKLSALKTPQSVKTGV